MIRAADEAMYTAKQRGKNTIEYRLASSPPSLNSADSPKF
jgi:hypothetical protein